MQGYTPKPIIGGDRNNDNFFRTRDDNIKSVIGAKQNFISTRATRVSSSNNTGKSKASSVIFVIIFMLIFGSMATEIFSAFEEVEQEPTGVNGVSIEPIDISGLDEKYSGVYSSVEKMNRNLKRKEKVGAFARAALQYATDNGSFPVDSDTMSIRGDFVSRYISENCLYMNDAQELDYTSMCSDDYLTDPSGDTYKLIYVEDMIDYGNNSLVRNEDYGREIYLFSHAECGVWGYDVVSQPSGRKMAFMINGEGMSFCETADLDNL